MHVLALHSYLCSIVPPPVNNVTVTNGTIRWSPFTFPHGIILYYEVAATRQFSDDETFYFNVTAFTIDLSTVLTPNGSYSVMVSYIVY